MKPWNCLVIHSPLQKCFCRQTLEKEPLKNLRRKFPTMMNVCLETSFRNSFDKQSDWIICASLWRLKKSNTQKSLFIAMLKHYIIHRFLNGRPTAKNWGNRLRRAQGPIRQGANHLTHREHHWFQLQSKGMKASALPNAWRAHKVSCYRQEVPVE